MSARKKTLFSAFVGAAVLIATATPALARMVHARAPAANQAHGSDGKVIGADPGQNIRSQRHGILACGEINYSDCETLKMMLPR